MRPVALHISFRSAPAILKAVDSVFARMRRRAGVSSEPVRHYPARPRKDEDEKIGRVEIWPLSPRARKEAVGDGVWALPLDYENEHDPQAELAARDCPKIAHWLKTEKSCPATERLITARRHDDLLRNRGRFADLMVRALKKSACR